LLALGQQAVGEAFFAFSAAFVVADVANKGADIENIATLDLIMPSAC
jgi:hypothetical protein